MATPHGDIVRAMERQVKLARGTHADLTSGLVVARTTRGLAHHARLIWLQTFADARLQLFRGPVLTGETQELFNGELIRFNETTAFVIGGDPDAELSADESAVFWSAMARAALHLDGLEAIPSAETMAFESLGSALRDLPGTVLGFGSHIVKIVGIAAGVLVLLMLMRSGADG